MDVNDVNKEMMLQQRIIVAVDVDSLDKAKALTDQLAPTFVSYKYGLELIHAVGTPAVAALSKSAFLDVKLNDIPNTVAGATRAIVRHKPWMFNVHCLGGHAMMKAARDTVVREMVKDNFLRRPLILGVTVLTSLDVAALAEMGIIIDDMTRFVVNLARLAITSGLDGVVASPQETSAIREEIPCDGFVIVNPGIRPKWSAKNDQERITTPYDAIRAGADYIVVGQPITKNEIGGPLEAVERIAEEIDQALNRSV